MLRSALSHIESGRFHEAERICREAMATQAESAGLTTLLALSLQGQDRYDEAIPLFRQLAQAPDARYEHWNNLGNTLRDAGRHAEADDALRQALQRAGENPGVLLNLGLNALDGADFDAATQWLNRALLQAPQDAEIRIYAAAAAFESADLARAHALLATAIPWQQLDPTILAEAAWLLFRLDHGDEAQRVLQLALQQAPQHPRVLIRAAAIHERCNRLEQARTIVDVLTALPTLPASVAEDLTLLRAALASRGHDTAQARQLHEELLRNAGDRPPNAAIYFSLARLCDREKDVAAAMQALQHAHAAQTLRVRQHSPELFASGAKPLLIAEYRVTAPQWASWPEAADAPSAEASPIFIVGFPRSGTTLLETMLDAHPALACMDERPYLQHVIDYMQDSGLRYPDDLAQLTATQCAAMRAIYRERVARHVHWGDGTQLVDKNPLNLLKLPLIRRLFPHARIILALRHPADVVLSNYMQNFRSPVFVAMCATLESTARGYASAMAFWCDQHALLGGRVFTLRYEDLVADMSSWGQRLTQFLDLPWHDALLRPQDQARKRGYISTPSYAQVLEPVNARAVGRWQPYAAHFEPLRDLLEPYAARWQYTL